ncbi:MAG TPA: hypothetical protein PKA55_11110 [Rhodoblastus sp.]|nr:hypothetical protein [Rhodoblastus sp.]
MTPEVELIALNYIAYASRAPDPAADEFLASGFAAMLDLVEDDPSTAWEIIKFLIQHYEEADYYAPATTEAQRVIGLLAAGPLEDLLSSHGPAVIEEVERNALQDRRWAWALGGVWRFQMNEDIWQRVQRAADNTWWDRSAPK